MSLENIINNLHKKYNELTKEEKIKLAEKLKKID